MKYIDTHCHIFAEYFETEDARDNVIKNAQKAGVQKLIIPGTNIQNSIEVMRTAKKHSHVYPAFGVHPSDMIADIDNIPEKLKQIDPKSLIALGEIGLDLYWSTNPPIEIQEKGLRLFLDYAIEHGLPVLLHLRNAEEDMYRILSDKKYELLRFVMHSYTGTWEWAEKFLKLRGYISFSGIVTFKNAKQVQEVAGRVPLNRILTETDTPYLAPTPVRGKDNLPIYVKHVADFIATIRLEEKERFIDAVMENAKRLFDFEMYDRREINKVNIE